MDTELLKTFLEVTKTRHFGRAADNLYLTQSAVSFRIRQLESQLGNALFSRQRGNVHLTAAGERLQPYAEAILQTWSRARQDVALSDSCNNQITLGATALVWEFDGMSDWVSRIYGAIPDLALRLETLSRQGLSKQILNKSIDVVITSEPPKIENLIVHEVRSYQLQLVCHLAESSMADIKELPLVYLDWGTRFAVEHSRINELQKTPILHSHSSKMALEHLLQNGGVGYLPSPVIAHPVEAGEIHVVKNAPVMEQTLYLVWREDNEKIELLDKLLDVAFTEISERV
ncbi:MULTISPECIES: HTH-type transcriptional regulator HdfR [unclassified Photobacterium]|uniref:HTH-type transcriptional regulator HdfR n=1 Tax=unclassified Photobacterium TaxID=2628852 RepID=UPI001B8C1278|nr:MULTISPECIES: HTH-type transcriptional regulator HdfR [unclassified Photobacterium]MDO6705933.1 HTH-type transcriptional regulator HdfR [Photobacterium sp. 1_MG-2023]QUJ69274.1 HTH-type transcriptional regulator HdfR [Photobacterium sp. GJ3]